MISHNFKSYDDLHKLIKNYALISLAESAKNTPGLSASTAKGLIKSKSVLGAAGRKSAVEKDLDGLEEVKSEGHRSEQEECIHDDDHEPHRQEILPPPQIQYN